MIIKQRLAKIKDTLPEDVTLIAVSKTYPVDTIKEAYNAGQRIFGENKVQEITQKQPLLPDDIQWHLIGHLQTNKVKYIAPFVSLIHSVDSEKLLIEINKRAEQNNRVIPVLLQVYIAEEETKFGFNESELDQILSPDHIEKYRFINVSGLMGMATNTDNEQKVQGEFKKLKSVFDRLQKETKSLGNVDFKYLSMGMSSDYKLAILEGSNMVRIGSAIFGSRS